MQQHKKVVLASAFSAQIFAISAVKLSRKGEKVKSKNAKVKSGFTDVRSLFYVKGVFLASAFSAKNLCVLCGEGFPQQRKGELFSLWYDCVAKATPGRARFCRYRIVGVVRIVF